MDISLERNIHSSTYASHPADWQMLSQEHAVVALIPAYNEERFIGSLVIAARAYVDQVIVIDDGSRDRTAAIAQKAGALVLQQVVNQGKAAAVNAGFNYIRQFKPTAVVMLDGDGQHVADDIPAVLQPILNDEADIVVGSRFLDVKSDIPAYRQVGQHGLTIVTNLASGVWVGDSQSGFRAFSFRALEQLDFSQGGFSLESEMQFLAREHSLRIAEAPIKVIYAEKAKRNPVSHGMQVLNGIMRLVGQIRPLLYFGVPGTLLFFTGMSLGLYIINIFLHTRTLAVGYGLVTVICCVLGMLLCFSGIILHSTRSMMTELRRCVVESFSLAKKDMIILQPAEAKRHESSDTSSLPASFRHLN